MDIGSMSMVNSTSALQSSWGIGMMSKELSANKQTGNAIVSMINSASPQQMEQSVNPTVGSNFDVSV